MPEYLSPGVYVEEVATGPRPIEGVSTSTAGFVGLTERGPTQPRLVTSWPQYQPWFEGFAGKAFRWQDAPTPVELPGSQPASARVFTVVPETGDGVIAFTRTGG